MEPDVPFGPDPSISFYLAHGGCLEINQTNPEATVDTIHICDTHQTAFIKALQHVTHQPAPPTQPCQCWQEGNRRNTVCPGPHTQWRERRTLEWTPQ